MSQDQQTPQEALASIREARASVAPSMDYPLGYDLAYGAVCGLLVAGQGMPQPWSLIVLPIALGGLAVITAGGLWLAARTVETREYVLEQ